MKRKHEYFTPNTLKCDEVITSKILRLFPQERDWTCSVACIRTMLSAFLPQVPDENFYIQKYRLNPGPHYSKEIRNLCMLEDYDAVYGCDCKDYTFDIIVDYLKQDYCVMLESMVNYSHWMVLLGYYPLSDNDIESANLLMFDPYYNNVRLINFDEFISMWRDGNYEQTRVDKDFIAIRKKIKPHINSEI